MDKGAIAVQRDYWLGKGSILKEPYFAEMLKVRGNLNDSFPQVSHQNLATQPWEGEREPQRKRKDERWPGSLVMEMSWKQHLHTRLRWACRKGAQV